MKPWFLLLLSLPTAATASARDGLKVSSPFGARHDPIDGTRAIHAGIDLPAAKGAHVLAAASGIVRVARRRGGYGNLVELSHQDGGITRYAHLSTILVQPGDAVVQGALIGYAGSSGRATGPHLHFEYRRGGVALNPLDYLGSRTPTATSEPRGALVGEACHRSRFARARDEAAADVTAVPDGTVAHRTLAR